MVTPSCMEVCRLKSIIISVWILLTVPLSLTFTFEDMNLCEFPFWSTFTCNFRFLIHHQGNYIVKYMKENKNKRRKNYRSKIKELVLLP